MSVVARAHSHLVFGRRVRVLAEALGAMIPHGGSLLDVGCGDGSIGRTIGDARDDLSVRGIEVLVRPGCHIPVEAYDGRSIPFDDGAVDFVMLVDVLHHVDDPAALLADAARTARAAVIVKDHTVQGPLARPTLRFMDWFGNAQHGVALPYNYWTPAEWNKAVDGLRLSFAARNTDIALYPFPASLVFGRGLHFVARLERRT